jgi:hypothetical protein
LGLLGPLVAVVGGELAFFDVSLGLRTMNPTTATTTTATSSAMRLPCVIGTSVRE